MKVSDLNFHTYSSVEDLRAEEEFCMYPPRFKISVNCLSHGKNLDTEFKIILENDGILDFDEVIKFPLIIPKYTTEVQSGKMAFTMYIVVNYNIINICIILIIVVQNFIS